MKSNIISFFLLLAICLPLGAKDAGSVIKRFKNEPGAEYVSVPRFVMMLASLDSKEARSVKSVQVLDMSGCSKASRDRILSEINTLSGCGYEDFVRVKEDGEQVRIMAVGDDDYIKDMVIFCCGDGECAVVRITGKIKPSEIDGLADEYHVGK